MENTYSVKLLERRQWREGLVSLRFEKPEGFVFKPGQFARLGLETPDGYVARAYSMASLPSEPFLEFFIVAVPGGVLSPRLTSLKAGESVFLEKELFGNMIPTRIPGGNTLWMLASGTGLAPFISICRDESMWQMWPTHILVHSVRKAEDLAYIDKIQSIAADSSLGGGKGRKLIHIPVVTREATEFLSQRIPALIEQGVLADKAGVPMDPENSRILLCGNPEMIQSVRDTLKPLGFKAPRRGNPGNLLSENLW